MTSSHLGASRRPAPSTDYHDWPKHVDSLECGDPANNDGSPKYDDSPKDDDSPDGYDCSSKDDLPRHSDLFVNTDSRWCDDSSNNDDSFEHDISPSHGDLDGRDNSSYRDDTPDPDYSSSHDDSPDPYDHKVDINDGSDHDDSHVYEEISPLEAMSHNPNIGSPRDKYETWSNTPRASNKRAPLVRLESL